LVVVAPKRAETPGDDCPELPEVAGEEAVVVPEESLPGEL
jgi:hypothetical protein